MYTLESLKEINPTSSYINEFVVKHVNQCIKEIKNDRNQDLPTYGDFVRFTDEYGEYYCKAGVQPPDGFVKENEIYICESGSYGFYCNHSISSSGGKWRTIHKSHFKPIGKTEGCFWIWGYNGACGGGGVNFNVEVNLWECNINKEKYSTEFYNKMYIYDHKKPDRDGYRFFGSFNSGKAFRTEEDFKAWIKTFNGIVEDLGENRIVVWYDKEYKHYISKKEYDAIENYVLDTCLCNGVRQCKRVYTDKRVDTYITYEIPELDWQTNKENMRARGIKICQ